MTKMQTTIEGDPKGSLVVVKCGPEMPFNQNNRLQFTREDATELLGQLADVGLRLPRRKIEATFTKFLALGLGYFGKGDSIPEALAQLKKAGHKKNEGKTLLFWGTDDLSCTTGGYVEGTNYVSLGEI